MGAEAIKNQYDTFFKRAKTSEGHFANMQVPIEQAFIRAKALIPVFPTPLTPASALAKSASTIEAPKFKNPANDDHPENGKNFPFWKKIVLFIGDLSAYISVLIWISPIPFGWILVPASTLIISIAVGPKHAKRHILKVVNEWKDVFVYGTFADLWMPWLLKKPFVRRTLNVVKTVSAPFRYLLKELIKTVRNGLDIALAFVRPKGKTG